MELAISKYIQKAERSKPLRDFYSPIEAFVLGGDLMKERAKRKMSAILNADVKGYSRLMGEDELRLVQKLK